MPNGGAHRGGDEHATTWVRLAPGECIRLVGTNEVRLEALTNAIAGAFATWHRIDTPDDASEKPGADGGLRPALLVLIDQHAWDLALQQARERYGNLPILAVGSVNEEEPFALDAGADMFCVTPLDQSIFEARARALLRRHSGCRSRESCSQELTLDAMTLFLRVGEVDIQLSRSEFTLIARLYERREHWVPRGELLGPLSQAHAAYDSSLLRTHIFNVRKKLGPCRWMIQTARGKGLMLTTNPAYQSSTDDRASTL